LKNQKLKMILMITLILCLSLSCKKMPLLGTPIERCGTFMEEVEEDLYVGKCRCHEYEITLKNIGRISESVDHPLSYCNKAIVFKASSSWAELRAWIEALVFWENERRKKKKKKMTFND